MRILLLSAAPCVHDARPRIVARQLAKLGHEATLLCRAAPGAPDEERLGDATLIRVDFDDLAPLARAQSLRAGARLSMRGLSLLRRFCDARRWGELERTMARTLEFWLIAAHAETLINERLGGSIDVAHAVCLPALPAAGRIAKLMSARLIYDAGELERDRNARYTPAFYHLRMALERFWIKHADAVTTVSAEIALQLARDYNIPRPTVIDNVAPRTSTSADVRSELRLGPETPLVVYIGVGMSDRGLVPAINAIGQLPGFHLAVVGPHPDIFMGRFRRFIVAAGAEGRIHPLPPRRPTEAAAFIQTSDVTVSAPEPICASYAFAAPNKLFQSVAAAVPIVVGRTPTQRRIVAETGVGEWVDERDPLALAAALTRQSRRKGGAEYMAARARFLALHAEAGTAADWSRIYARAQAAIDRPGQ